MLFQLRSCLIGTARLLPWVSCGLVGFLAAAAPVHAAWADGATQAVANGAKVVKVDLSDFGREDPSPKVPFGPAKRNFLGELKRLRQIAADADVKAIRLDPKNELDDARTLDVLKELRALKAAGKKILCYAESLDRDALVFATIADLVAVPPSGTVELRAPAAEVLYLKGLLDKIGVRLEVLHVGEFKTAYEQMYRETMSAEQRQELTELLRERYEQCVDLIAAQRNVPKEKVEAGFDKIWLEPQEAKELGLIDLVGYADEFDARTAELLGEKPAVDEHYGTGKEDDLKSMLDSPLAIFSVLRRAVDGGEESLPSGDKVAIVYCSGAIDSGKSRSGFGGATSMGSETIVKALDQARDNDEVKAVVLRVNSPGGSALASDMIWRAVQRVREKKPVVASMGGVAASGGYWISMGCDKIVAQPSTITGSIGVVSAAPDLSKVLEKVGISVEVVGYGPHAEELSVLRDGLTPLMKEKIQSSMQRIYGEFVRKAAAGRKLDAARLEPNARGRVWTGRKAKEIGLVDGLGGLQDAITMACFLGGHLDAQSTPVLELPEAPGLFEQLQEALSGLASTRTLLQGIAREAGVAEALPRLEAVLGRDAADGRLAAPRFLCLMPELFRRR
jgi:protease IV